MDIEVLFTNQALEDEGVWFPYRDKSRVKVASAANRVFRQFVEAQMKPYDRQKARGVLDPDIEDEIYVRGMAKFVLKDWDGFLKKGKKLPFSEEAAYDLMMNSRPFRNDISTFAADEEAFRATVEEEAEKN